MKAALPGSMFSVKEKREKRAKKRWSGVLVDVRNFVDMGLFVLPFIFLFSICSGVSVFLFCFQRTGSKLFGIGYALRHPKIQSIIITPQ